MENRTEIYEAKLCAEAVDEFSDHIRAFLEKKKIKKRDILRYAMTLEEILLDSLEEKGDGIDIKLSMGRKFLSYFITLEVGGEIYNVYAEEAEEGILKGSLLKNLGLSPEYRFIGDVNRYSFRIKEKSSNGLLPIAVAALLAVAFGYLGYLLSDTMRLKLLNDVLLPVNDTFLGILGCIAGPMIFLSVAWGIYGIGDAATFKNIGKKLCLTYISSLFIISASMCLICMPLFKLDFSSSNGISSGFSTAFSMILDIVPKDIFSPFVNGNTLQIIFIAVIIGIAMLFLGQKTDFVAKIVEQINYIVQFLIEAICKLVPGFVFIVILKLIWSDMISSLLGIGELVAVFLSAAFLGVLCLVMFTAILNKVSPLKLIKKGLGTFAIAVSTASSAAAFGSNMHTSQKEYGIDEKLCSFGIPLGVVMFKPIVALNYMIQCMFFAQMYHLKVSASWIVIMIITCVILSVATTPIPGGGMAIYAVIFTQLGIPSEALAIALACESVFDFIITGLDQFGIPLMLLNQAGRLGFVNREILLKSNDK